MFVKISVTQLCDRSLSIHRIYLGLIRLQIFHRDDDDETHVSEGKSHEKHV